MSSLNKVDIKHCVITPADQTGSINLKDLSKTFSHDFAAVKSVVHVDYFEDILSPSVTAYVKISETSNVISKLEGKDFYTEIEWPKFEKALLIDDKVTIVVQIDGKKRGLISTNRDSLEKEVVDAAKKIENITKNLKDKQVMKNIFVKNKIINFITK